MKKLSVGLCIGLILSPPVWANGKGQHHHDDVSIVINNPQPAVPVVNNYVSTDNGESGSERVVRYAGYAAGAYLIWCGGKYIFTEKSCALFAGDKPDHSPTAAAIPPSFLEEFGKAKIEIRKVKTIREVK